MSKQNGNNDDKRKRNWATIVYPESAPEGWQRILSEMNVTGAISPLHEKDLDDEGNIKKPHYHIILCYDGKKSYNQMIEVFSKIGGVGAIPVESKSGYLRYLCHLDNPEKVKYSTTDVIPLGGLDYTCAIARSEDKYRIISEMIDFCMTQNLHSYNKLLEYAKDYNMEWFRILCDNGTYVMREYLKSKKWTDDHRDLEENDMSDKKVLKEMEKKMEKAKEEYRKLNEQQMKFVKD